mmetsp:Transcript_20466/g.33644  ORF Transcript_20466/g.33644 Transcript_20466/m.33644 type:complete len:551 (+) Transcript_20466:208-1860(+)
MFSRKIAVLALAVIAILSSTAKAQITINYTRNIVYDWNEKLIQVIRADKIPSQFGALYFASLNSIIYETLGQFSRPKSSFVVLNYAGWDQDLAIADPIGAGAFAGHYLLSEWFKTKQEASFSWTYPANSSTPNNGFKQFKVDYASFNSLLNEQLTNYNIPSGDIRSASRRVARNLYRAIWRDRVADGSNDFVALSVSRVFRNYTYPATYGQFVLASSQRSALYPQLNATKTFVINSITTRSTDSIARAPAPQGDRSLADLLSVKDLGRKDSTVRTEKETENAIFWWDPAGTASVPGRWIYISIDLIEKQTKTNLTLLQKSQILAQVSTAMADVGIVAWDVKYKVQRWRPATALVYGGLFNTSEAYAQYIDTTFKALLPVPAHPEYPSGHSASAGAAIGVLTAWFGDNSTAFTTYGESEGILADDGVTVIHPGVANVSRVYKSLKKAGQDVGLSRVQGGIHYQYSADEGLSLGTSLGKSVQTGYPGRLSVTPPATPAVWQRYGDLPTETLLPLVWIVLAIIVFASLKYQQWQDQKEYQKILYQKGISVAAQ